MSNLNDKTLEFAEKLASSIVEERIAEAKIRQRDKPQFAKWDGETCFDCGGDIPEARIALGRVRCVYCQEAAEKNGRD